VNRSTLALCVGLTALQTPATAANVERGENRARVEPTGFLYGGALGIRREIYKDFDRRVIPLPILGYRGERLEVYGPFVSYEFLEIGGVQISGLISPRFNGFDESDSDVFEGMEDRKFSMDAGLGIGYEVDDWKMGLSSRYDVLGRSEGNEIIAKLGKVYRTGPIFIEPAIGLSYLDSSHVDYYYGVDDSEATPERQAFEGDDALNTTLGVTFISPALFNGLTRVGIQKTWFDSSITDSPLTDSDAGLEYFLTFSKFF